MKSLINGDSFLYNKLFSLLSRLEIIGPEKARI